MQQQHEDQQLLEDGPKWRNNASLISSHSDHASVKALESSSTPDTSQEVPTEQPSSSQESDDDTQTLISQEGLEEDWESDSTSFYGNSLDALDVSEQYELVKLQPGTFDRKTFDRLLLLVATRKMRRRPEIDGCRRCAMELAFRYDLAKRYKDEVKAWNAARKSEAMDES